MCKRHFKTAHLQVMHIHPAVNYVDARGLNGPLGSAGQPPIANVNKARTTDAEIEKNKTLVDK